MVCTAYKCSRCGRYLYYDIEKKDYSCGRCRFNAPALSFLKRRTVERRKKYADECNRAKRRHAKKKREDTYDRSKRELF
jgi:DNA-directed RNA polymerase subunit RPC12/RpoP